MPWRDLARVLVGVAIAMLGVVLGAELQEENALPADLRSQQLFAGTGASGDIVALTGVLVALGATIAMAAVQQARAPWRDWRPWGATFGGAYITVNLLQTMWPHVIGVDTGENRAAVLFLNLFASNAEAAPSVLVPIAALAIGGLLLLFWGIRAMRPRPLAKATWAGLLQSQSEAMLLAAPFLAIAASSAVLLMLSLPPVLNSGPYRAILSLSALGYIGLLGVGGTKAWRLWKATRPSPDGLDLDSWKGLGRLELGLAVLLAVLALVGFVLPSFPPQMADCSRTQCAPNDPAAVYGDQLRAVGDLLLSGRTFGTKELHIHLTLLLSALVPLTLAWRGHGRARDLANQPSAPAGHTPRRWPQIFLFALLACLLLGALATWFFPGALWAWVAALLPCALATRWLGRPVREVQLLLLLGWAMWGIGNSLQAHFNAASGLQFISDPSWMQVWRILGAILAAWAMVRAARTASVAERPSLTLPLLAGVAIATVAILLLEFTLGIWGDTFTEAGTAHPPSVYVGTEVAGAGGAAAITVHSFSTILALAAAAMLLRLLRPDLFKRRGNATKTSTSSPMTS